MSDMQPEFKPSDLSGHVRFEVPWKEAEKLRDTLCTNGVQATVCLDSQTHSAAIEIPSGISPEAVSTALHGQPVKHA